MLVCSPFTENSGHWNDEIVLEWRLISRIFVYKFVTKLAFKLNFFSKGIKSKKVLLMDKTVHLPGRNGFLIFL